MVMVDIVFVALGFADDVYCALAVASLMLGRGVGGLLYRWRCLRIVGTRCFGAFPQFYHLCVQLLAAVSLSRAARLASVLVAP